MCGLSLVVNWGERDGAVGALAAMHAPIQHRGPDGEGFGFFSVDGGCMRVASFHAFCTAATSRIDVALAFRWLQIQDRHPESAQPFASPDGTLQVVFNGEIYNFRELRAELEALGRRFRTQSDTEVVLAAYEAWGMAAFARLDGMWAIAIVDARRRKVVVSRDRFGIKPLFYAFLAGRVLFASEVKQLLAAGAASSANAAAVKRFIHGARPAEPEETFFAAIHAVPAATCAEIDLGVTVQRLTFEAYWELRVSAASSRFDDACDALDCLLSRSVASHLVSIVPMGVLVSGGLDSSLLAALSNRPFEARGERGSAFSMVLDEPSRLDERPHIRTIVSSFGLEGFSAALTPDWLKANIDAVTRAQEEPVAGIAVAGQYLAYQLAGAQGTRVVLDGQGADELFGGYARHQTAYLRDCLRRAALGRILAEASAIVVRDRQFVRDALARALQAGARRRAVGGLALARAGARAPAASLDQMLRHDVLRGNMRAVLGITDRNAMAHSVEARVPYVDRTVVEFAFRLPDHFKVGRGLRKRILRCVARRHLPASILARRDRIGFGAPTRDWLRLHFDAELREISAGEVFHDRAVVDAGLVKAYVAAFLDRKHQDAGTVWRLFAIDRWVRAYAVTGL